MFNLHENIGWRRIIVIKWRKKREKCDIDSAISRTEAEKKSDEETG